MKKLLSFALAFAMIATALCAVVLNVSAYDEPVYPELVITEIEFNPSGTDYYDCIEIMNTTNTEINLYDYALGYGGSAKAASYEKELVEITPFRGGNNWLDIGDDVSATYTSTAVNPESGIIAPKEVVLLWCIDSNSYDDSKKMTKTVNDFRLFYGVDEDIKVFCVDSNTASDKNFSVKNSDTGVYSIVKYSDDLNTKTNVKGNKYTTPNGYMEEPAIISWAVVDCRATSASGTIMAANGGPASDTKTLNFNWNEDNQKRMVPISYEEETLGALNPAQKAVLNPVRNVANKDVCSVTNGTTTVNYKTIEEAVAALNDGDTLTLIENVEIADSIVLTKSVTLDGNGKKLTNDTSASAIKVEGAAINVTVKNLKIESEGNGVSVVACADEASRSTIKVTDCEIEARDEGIRLDAYWNVTVSGCTVNSGNRGIYTNGDGFNNTVIENCTVNAFSDYGIYFRTQSTAKVENTRVTSNGSSAIQVITSAKDSGTTLTINNATVVGNKAYCVAVNPNNTVYINGGSYKTTGADAAINAYGYGAYTKITDGYFECDKNCAIRVYWSNSDYADCGIPVLDIYGGTFVYTDTTDDGSALRVGTKDAWGTANIYGGTFKTYGPGPVLNYVRSESIINIYGGTYENCGTYDIKIATQRLGGNEATDRDYLFPEGATRGEYKDGVIIDPDAQPEVTEPAPEDTTVPTPEDTTVPTPEDTTVPTPEDTTVPTPEDTTVTTPEDTTAPTPEDTTVESKPADSETESVPADSESESTPAESDEPTDTSVTDTEAGDGPIVGDNIVDVIITVAISLVVIGTAAAFVVVKKKSRE